RRLPRPPAVEHQGFVECVRDIVGRLANLGDVLGIRRGKYDVTMKILLAGPRGFCAGVNMAIDTLDLAIQLYGTPIYVYHEIVHNRHVVDRFRGQGAVFVNDLTEVPEGSRLLFSAHGISPEVRRLARERRLQTIDATCPLVTKVHLEALRFARQGYTILLV